MKCSCGMENVGDLQFCDGCGRRLAGRGSRESAMQVESALLWGFVLLGVVIAMSFLAFELIPTISVILHILP